MSELSPIAEQVVAQQAWREFLQGGPPPTDKLGASQHELLFKYDALETEMPIPRAYEMRTCDCPPECYHADDCPAFPAYAATVEYLGYAPDSEKWAAWPTWHWVCISQTEFNGDDIYAHHTGGEINGPEHFCPFSKTVVSPPEQ